MNKKKKISVLLIYTGGTIGMMNDPFTGLLVPIDFKHISNQVPELVKFGYTPDLYLSIRYQIPQI